MYALARQLSDLLAGEARNQCSNVAAELSECRWYQLLLIPAELGEFRPGIPMHLGWYSPRSGFVSSARKPPPVLEDAQLLRKWGAEGQFWLPEATEEKLWGRVDFSPGLGPRLRLEGSFWPRAYGRRGGISCPVIHGVLFNGAPCTLFGALVHVEVYIADRNYERSTATANELLVGEQFVARDEAQFDTFQIAYHPLTEWLPDPYGLSHDYAESLKKTTLTFQPATFDASLRLSEREFKVKLFCSRNIPLGASRGEIKWTFQYHFVILPDDPAPLGWFLEVATLLRRCLMFLVGEAAYTLSLRAAVPKSAEGEDHEIPTTVEIWLPVAVPAVVRTDKDYLGVEFTNLQERLPSILEEWFRRRGELETVTRGYSEILLNDGAEEEGIFLRICQTLEHFHGVLFPKSRRYLTRGGWKKLRAWLAENLPDPLPGDCPTENSSEESNSLVSAGSRQILLSRIGSLNQLSFRSRIEELCRKMPLRELYPILDNPPPNWEPVLNEFPGKVEATRHYLTHYAEDQRSKVLAGDELEKATSRLFAIMTFWLARALKIEEKQAGNFALNAMRAMFLVSRKTEL